MLMGYYFVKKNSVGEEVNFHHGKDDNADILSTSLLSEEITNA